MIIGYEMSSSTSLWEPILRLIYPCEDTALKKNYKQNGIDFRNGRFIFLDTLTYGMLETQSLKQIKHIPIHTFKSRYEIRYIKI